MMSHLLIHLELDLPLLDKMYKEMKSPSEKLQKLQKIIKDADGYMFQSLLNTITVFLRL